MAKLSSTYASMPVNISAKKKILRQARLGTRPTSRTSNAADAFLAVTAAQRYREAFVRDQANIDLFRVTAAAWAARKDWRP